MGRHVLPPPFLVCMLIASYIWTRIPQFLRKHMQKKMHRLRLIVFMCNIPYGHCNLTMLCATFISRKNSVKKDFLQHQLSESLGTVARLEDMLVMHCMTNAVLECHFYLKLSSTNCSAKRSPLYNNTVYSKKPFKFVLTDDFS